jgi:DHA2 family lincomycin resistance protein-like MFS transporter
MITGALFDGAGLWFLSTLEPGTALPVLLATYMFIIVGQAFLWTPTFAASLGALDKHLLPHGSAIMNTIQQLAGAAGIAIAFAIMTKTSATLMAGGELVGPAMARGAQHSHQIALGMVIVGLFVALAMPKNAARGGVPVLAH